MDISNLKITIVGAKRSGLALCQLAKKLKAEVRLTDSQSVDQLSLDTRDWLAENNIKTEFGKHTEEFIQESRLIVLSPGVPYDCDLTRWARRRNIPILGEIEFAYQFCEKPVIAVTGSNGKTTVVTLITEVLKTAGFKPCLCGNVGVPFSQFALDSSGYDYMVLEISSFQLETLLNADHPLRRFPKTDRLYMKGFKPFIAVFLNFCENHLDRHNDFLEYFEAKKKIFLNQDAADYAVLNSQQKSLGSLMVGLKSVARFFGKKTQTGAPNPNQQAVMEVAGILGISPALCLNVFKNFKGVEHRMEWVRELEGVDFINDSKATTAEASRWALSRLDQPILMICGGLDKKIDFSVLREIVQQKVKMMFAIGSAKEKIRKTFESVVPVVECSSLENAVKAAREKAQTGDCVLLSPMCASFDMFNNYEHRGTVFKEIVHKLATREPAEGKIK